MITSVEGVTTEALIGHNWITGLDPAPVITCGLYTCIHGRALDISGLVSEFRIEGKLHLSSRISVSSESTDEFIFLNSASSNEKSYWYWIIAMKEIL